MGISSLFQPPRDLEAVGVSNIRQPHIYALLSPFLSPELNFFFLKVFAKQNEEPEIITFWLLTATWALS